MKLGQGSGRVSPKIAGHERGRGDLVGAFSSCEISSGSSNTVRQLYLTHVAARNIEEGKHSISEKKCSLPSLSGRTRLSRCMDDHMTLWKFGARSCQDSVIVSNFALIAYQICSTS